MTVNVAPTRMRNLVAAALKKDAEEVERINAPLRALRRDQFCEANPIPIKRVIDQIGAINCAYLRPPLDDLSPKFHGIVENVLKEVGLLFDN